MKDESVIKIIKQKEAILFDLFHTLTALESTWSNGPMTSEMLGVDRKDWNEQVLEKSRERLAGKVKDPLVIIRNMAHAIDKTISEEVVQSAVNNRIKRFEGALINIPKETTRVLKTLKKMNKKIGLVSNADISEIVAWDKSPIAHLFDSVIFSCEVGCVKPEPEIYNICIKELGVKTNQCLFVGDGGSRELEGAKNLGITTIMITGIISELWPDKIAERRPHADYVIEQLTELI